MTGAAAPGASRRGFDALFVAALGLGAWLRAWQLDTQVLLDDEWHALHKLLRSGWYDVFTRFGYADHSIPLTLYYKALQQTVGLSEAGMHAPMLVAGVALIAAAPWFARTWAAWPTRALWSGLLAVSPLLIYHSRTARPYAVTSLLTFVAIVAYWRRRQGDAHPRLLGVAYAACTCIAGWLHPITLPFTLAPFAFDAIALARTPRGAAPPRFGQVAALAFATLVPLALVLAPPLVVDWHMFAAKGGTDWVTPESAWRTVLMLFGTGHAALALALAALAAWGGWRIAQRDAALARYLLFVAACGIAATVLARPRWIHHPLVAARYLIPLVPFLLLCVAEGLAATLAAVAPPRARPWLAAGALAGVALLSPLPAQLRSPNQFSGHLRYQFDYDPAHNPYVLQIPRDPVPDFYLRLGRLPPGSRTLVEAPWRLESNFNPHAWYQDVHRQLVRIGFVTPVCGNRDFGEFPEGRGLRMRQFVHLEALLRGETGGADYLVLHATPWKTPPDAELEWPDVARCVAAAEAVWGPPAYRDADIVVFALKPERRSGL